MSATAKASSTANSPAIDYPVYDCDHHFYEPPEAFLRHLPKQYQSYFQYVTLANGRTKLLIDGVLSDYIPNPTFNVVAAPGSHENFYRGTNPESLTLLQMGKPIKSEPAFHNGAAHLKVMDEQNVQVAVIFPTLASVIEERLSHKPDVINALFHSLNQWVAEEYGFTNGRQFPVAAICLSDINAAMQELEFVIGAGCKFVQIRPAPVPGPFGGRSLGSREFDPFWARCEEAGIIVTQHVGDSGYDYLHRMWTGGETKEWHPFESDAFREALDTLGRPAADAIASLVCGGVFDRFPKLRIAAVEAGSAWLEPLLKRLALAYKKLPKSFGSDPVKAVKDHLWIMPFYEESAKELGELLGMDKVLFGSDWPHPEGLAQPLDYFADIADLSPADQRKVMSDNLKNLIEGRV